MNYVDNSKTLIPSSLRARDARHHIHPFSDMNALNAEGTRVITHADGVWLQDVDGRSFLDGFSGLWNVAIGYGRREIADAVHAQMLDLPFYNSFFKSTTVPAIELAEMLAALAPGFRRTFFTNSGSEANDTIIRMVRHYWQLRGKPAKTYFIARHNGYHGSTIGGASLGGMAWMHAQGGLPIPGVVHVAQPWWWGEGGTMTPDAFGLWAAGEVARAIDEVGAENVAAFIGEPVQGAGGVIVPPDRADLPRPRCVDRERRGNLRIWPAGHLVRLPAFRFHPRPDDHRQGAHLRLSADGRGNGGRRDCRRAGSRRRF